LSEQGLRYSLEQTATYVSLSDVMQGDSTLGFYTFDLKTKWAVFDAPAAGTAGWISAQIEAKYGLGSAGDHQSAKSNLGTTTDPTGIWSDHNGWRIPELAWQESLRNGELVIVAGIVSQRNYLDGNAVAHTGRGEFMNSALIHSQVLPLAEYNFGLNLQWQPMEEWYVIVGGSAGDAPVGSVPWTDFSWEDWSVVGEFGYAPEDFLGLGPGVYRVQRFVAGNDGRTQDGMCLNIQQHLGPHSPFAWFGRFGYGGSHVTPDAATEIGTGLVMQAPLKYAGLVPKLSNDLLGVGFVWSQPPATTKTVYHENEYVLETFYTLQLTPTLKLQSDFQFIWDPAFNPSAGPATVFQLQLNLAW
jgi:carbohydrate-selective porin OprB